MEETLSLPSDTHPWTVAKVNNEVKGYIDRLGFIWVEGEIAQWTPRGLNVFGKLKDLHEESALDIAIWQSSNIDISSFKQGDKVTALLKPAYWTKQGQIKFICSVLKQKGLGELLEKLEKLKKQLAGEGVFDAKYKKPIPFLPNKIGLITGKNSDAEKDVLTNARLRWPASRFRVINTLVQGPNAAKEVIDALKILDADETVDIIVIARGGGEFLHLLPFSDEALVRAVFEAKTPIVSAIGHENDNPLLDYVADLRASTPTDAAKKIVPDLNQELLNLEDARNRAITALQNKISYLRQHLTAIASRPHILSYEWIFSDRWQNLLHIKDKLAIICSGLFHIKKAEIERFKAQINSLNPKSILSRGYAIVSNKGKTLLSSKNAKTDDEINITLSDGSLKAKVL